MREYSLLPALLQTLTISFNVDRGTVREDPVKYSCYDYIIPENLRPFLI
jgi:hypothetical protein